MPSVAVVGSGQTGLICAADLARKGIEVTLVERLPDHWVARNRSPISRGSRAPCGSGELTASLAPWP